MGIVFFLKRIWGITLLGFAGLLMYFLYQQFQHYLWGKISTSVLQIITISLVVVSVFLLAKKGLHHLKKSDKKTCY